MKGMSTTYDESHEEIRKAVKQLCARFPETYWSKMDAERRYPEEFIAALTQGGWLSILVPEEFGGAGLGMREASIVLEEINRSGGSALAAHAQMYTMGALLRHGSLEQKAKWLPEIASGKLRLQAFALTEPTAGSETTSITTLANKEGDHYRVSGQKVWTSRIQHSDLMMLLARTTPRNNVQKKTDGLSLFLVDLRDPGVKDRIRVNPINIMIGHETNEVFFDDAMVPSESLIGEEGKGFRYVFSGINAERILVSSECIGDGYYFTDKSVSYSKSRVVFEREIGQNQGVQFPIAKAYMSTRAAELMRDRAAELFDRGKDCAAEANMAKYLSSEASWDAANVAMNTFGGYGFSVAFNIVRKFRENRLYMVAPVANNLVLSFVGEHVLGMPRSY